MSPPSDRAGGARARYLEVAVNLATRADPRPYGPPLIASAVSLQEVARELGRPRTALYRMWDTQHDFWLDLSEYLVLNGYAQTEEAMPWRVGIEGGHAPGEAPSEILETFRVVANLLQDLVFDDVWVLVRAASLGYGDYPRVVEMRANVERVRISDLARTIEDVTRSVERYFVRSRSVFDVAALIWAIADGLAVIHSVMPEIAQITVPIDDGKGAQPWKLLGVASRAILEQATTPVIGGAGPGSGRLVQGSLQQDPRGWPGEQAEVLAVASRLFVERFRAGGPAEISAYGDLTIDRLARTAGVSRRAIYNVWPSVTDLRLDLLVSLLEGRAVAYRDVLGGVTPTDYLSAFITALLAMPSPTTVPMGHAALAFLVDLNNHAVRDVFASASRNLIEETRQWLVANWPPDPAHDGPRVPHDALAVLVIALAAGVNRLRRTCPTADVTSEAAAAAVEAFAALSLDGGRSRTA